MLFWSYLGICVGMYFEVPLLPMFVAAALFQCGAAYVLTKNNRVINMAIGVVIPTLVLFVQTSIDGQYPDQIPGWVHSANVGIIYLCAGISLIGATICGLFGRVHHADAATNEPG